MQRRYAYIVASLIYILIIVGMAAEYFTILMASVLMMLSHEIGFDSWIRHPNFFQIFAAASSCGIHAIVVHDGSRGGFHPTALM